jgi:tetratricopeptide (TPR) repeat protein
MDVKQEYIIAFELASTGRYQEARAKLLEILQCQPAYIDALLLLGKVEYYLKLFIDSGKRFEMVLTYEPGNFAAYFGLEYYKERARKIRFYIVMIVVFIFFSAAAGFLYFSLSGAFSEELGVLEQTVTQQSLQLKDMKESIIKTRLQRDKELLKNLEPMADSIDKSIKRLKAEISLLKREQKKILENLKMILESLSSTTPR